MCLLLWMKTSGKCKDFTILPSGIRKLSIVIFYRRIVNSQSKGVSL